MVWTLPPENNWVGEGRRFYFILIYSPPTFSFLAFAFSRARTSGARAFVEVLLAWYGRCGPREFGDWAGFSFYYFGTRGRRLCSFFERDLALAVAVSLGVSPSVCGGVCRSWRLPFILGEGDPVQCDLVFFFSFLLGDGCEL
jgi:hypothetical protein